MKFVIHVASLNCEDSDLALMDRIVDRLADQVHSVEMPEPDLLESSRWYENARQTRRKVLMSALAGPPVRGASGPGPHKRAVELKDAESICLAEKLAHAPLVILVEDREADGVLLDLVVEELGWPALRALWGRAQQVTPRAIEIDSAGGVGSIPIRIERAAGDAVSENRPVRHFVLFDSDARWPGDAIKAIEAVRLSCHALNVPHHLWRKRSAENYIPDQVFEAARDDSRSMGHADRFEALLRRSRPQRDHFPVKDGLSPAERIEALNAGLYSSSEEEELKLLEGRLFPRKPRPLLRLSKERRKSFTAAGLRARDGEGELDALLASIAQEL